MGYISFGVVILAVVTPLLGLLLRDRPLDKGLMPYGASDVDSEKKRGEADKPSVEMAGVMFGKAVRMPVVLWAYAVRIHHDGHVDSQSVYTGICDRTIIHVGAGVACGGGLLWPESLSASWCWDG